MSGFDEARGGGGGGGSSRGGGRRGGGVGSKASGTSGFDVVSQGGGSAASASSQATASTYQGGDGAYAVFRDGLERDLRKLTALAAATRTQVEKLGGKADGVELRKRM